MISIVTVYSNEQILKENLLKSLQNQSSEYELISIDNTQKAFTSASRALNYGGGSAKGDFILFVHQDVQLSGDGWLEDCERILRKAPEKAVFGSAGVTNTGRLINTGIDAIFLNPGRLFEEVQSLNEQLLIVPKALFQEFKFDETFDDWHCYVVDYCLSLKKQGVNILVLNLPIFHNSPRFNRGSNLKREQLKLWRKHGKDFGICFTADGMHGADPLTSVIANVLVRLQFVRGLGIGARYILFCYVKIYNALRNIKARFL